MRIGKRADPGRAASKAVGRYRSRETRLAGMYGQTIRCRQQQTSFSRFTQIILANGCRP
jgi:hypothetical protein